MEDYTYSGKNDKFFGYFIFGLSVLLPFILAKFIFFFNPIINEKDFYTLAFVLYFSIIICLGILHIWLHRRPKKAAIVMSFASVLNLIAWGLIVAIYPEFRAELYIDNGSSTDKTFYLSYVKLGKNTKNTYIPIDTIKVAKYSYKATDIPLGLVYIADLDSGVHVYIDDNNVFLYNPGKHNYYKKAVYEYTLMGQDIKSSSKEKEYDFGNSLFFTFKTDYFLEEPPASIASDKLHKYLTVLERYKTDTISPAKQVTARKQQK